AVDLRVVEAAPGNGEVLDGHEDIGGAARDPGGDCDSLEHHVDEGPRRRGKCNPRVAGLRAIRRFARAGGGALEQQLALDPVAGERGGALELGARLVPAAELRE